MKIPSHTTIAAYASLFIALGGTSYAAVKLPANSIGSREIKPRSIHTSDLALDARPSSKSFAFRTAVSEVILDPSTQAVVDSLAGAVKGEPGPQGAQGVAVEGPRGAAGSDGKNGADGANGADGPRGESLGYGHVDIGGATNPTETTPNVHVTKPASAVGTYCLDTNVGSNLVVTIDMNSGAWPTNALPYVGHPNPATSDCAGSRWEIAFSSMPGADPNGTPTGGREDHGFYFVLN
jgi:hypothetical protein